MDDPAPDLADSHVHLHAYDDDTVDAMLRRAESAGVRRIVAVSVDLPSAHRTLALTRRLGGRVVAAIGLHPNHLAPLLEPAEWLELERLAGDDLVRAIGECGVDGIDSPVSSAAQLSVLARLARLAVHLDKPILLHLRGDELIGPALGVLANAGLPPGRGVVHYFVGDARLAARYLDAGLSISIGKPATRIENTALREAIRGIPIDRLLLETDTYPLTDRTTEPADVRLIAAAVAELRGSTLAAIAEATSRNLRRLLGEE